ncbi:MAG: hypothetical protein PHX93_00835 [Candidatus Peribacteraceae bacterium]|jgi:hypothetical protein|nr:hypothetical protein [Candidatus Peribacteraceae bacterium]
MNQKTFMQELAKLIAIPAVQAARARIVGEGLSDADRAQFMKKLTEAHAALSQAHVRQLKALDGFDSAVRNMSRRLKKEVREEAEQAERSRNLGSAEEQIVNLS